MHKREVAHILRVIGRLLEIKGEEGFKVRAYEKAAQFLESTTVDVERLAREGRLEELPGIGKNLAPKIEELVLTGQSSYLNRLLGEIPRGLLDIVQVPGIGPKTARAIYYSLGVRDLDDLEQAVENGDLKKVPGLGPKRVSTIARGVKEIKRYQGKVLLGLALPVAERFVKTFRERGIRAEIVGEIRRASEVVSSIDLLLLAEKTNPVEMLKDVKISSLGDAGLLEQAWDREQEVFLFQTPMGVPLKIFVAKSHRDFLAKLLWLTGPPEHLSALSSIARNKGYTLTKAGLFKGSRVVSFQNEEELYGLLGLSFVPPEVRHRNRFLKLAVSQKPIRLVQEEEILGDLHVHTNWSDGVAGIEEMVKKAISLGYSYIAITDHATKVKVINGLDSEKAIRQVEAIKEISKRYPTIRILSGVEVDILKDGSLCLPEEVLSKLDLVVASIHQDIGDSRGNLIQRLVKAIQNPHVDIIAHPTGRLIGKRPGYSRDFEKIFEAARKHGTILEINSSVDRLDLPEDEAKEAFSAGVKLVISTDAHSPECMEDMRYGVLASARRAGLPPESIINTRELASWYPPKRSRS